MKKHLKKLFSLILILITATSLTGCITVAKPVFNDGSPTVITITLSTVGSGTVTGEGDYEVGETVALTATPESGYLFTSWSLNGTVVSTESSYSFVAQASGEYVATFTQTTVLTYTVTLNRSVGGVVTGAGTFDEDSSVTIIATANSGYHFVGWHSGGSSGSIVSTSSTYTFILIQNIILYAEFSDSGIVEVL
ncbi:MAG: InlB B-repeat-containing protein [Spirochaetales bacterium]